MRGLYLRTECNKSFSINLKSYYYQIIPISPNIGTFELIYAPQFL